MARITIEGLDELEKALKENVTMNDVKRVVRFHGAALQSRMQDKADFKKGYQTGETKGKIMLDFEDGGFTAAVGPTTEYALYLEYGTRFMDAQPFIRPAHNEQKEKFKNDMNKLVR